MFDFNFLKYVNRFLLNEFAREVDCSTAYFVRCYQNNPLRRQKHNKLKK